MSGCIDIVVVKQEDGTLASSPFHVRYGKLKLLKSSEKMVKIYDLIIVCYLGLSLCK